MMENAGSWVKLKGRLVRRPPYEMVAAQSAETIDIPAGAARVEEQTVSLFVASVVVCPQSFVLKTAAASHCTLCSQSLKVKPSIAVCLIWWLLQLKLQAKSYSMVIPLS